MTVTARKLLAINLLVILIIGFAVLRFVEFPIQNARRSEPLLWPNTKVGELDISNHTVREARAQLDHYLEHETFLVFPHRVRKVSYRDVGVRLKSGILEQYSRRCSLLDLQCQSSRPEMPLEKVLIQVDEEAYDDFILYLNEEVKALLHEVEIDFDRLSFRAHGSEATIAVDEKELRSQLVPGRVFSNEPLSISTIVKYPSGYSAQHLETEQLADSVAAQSLLIKYGRQPIYVDPSILRSFITLRETGPFLEAVIMKDTVGEYIDSLSATYDVDATLERERAIVALANALLFRVGGESPYTALILPLKGEPTTDGSYADKYLEIVKSQQRMYAFENEHLVDTYIVGTGLLRETPSGNHQILRKEGTAISYSGGWYMPYYMPLGTIGGGFFGLHEIPYRMNAHGVITTRNVNTMGSPATGGCVQLYREDAQHLYEWADVGIPVLIRD